MQAAHPVSVHSHIFSIALLNEHGETSICEMSDCPDIFLEVGTGQSLVGGVEKGNQLLFLHGICDDLPLLGGGVGCGGVVGTDLEKDNISLLGFLQ